MQCSRIIPKPSNPEPQSVEMLSSPKLLPDAKRLGTATHPIALCLGASSQSALGVRLGGVSGEQSGIEVLPVYLEYLTL